MQGQPEGAETWNLNDVRAAFRAAGCQRLYAKVLATNDDTKKQIYLGGDLSALSLLPFGSPRASDSEKSQAQFADLDFFWLVEHGELAKAPTAKLIVYPDYPEVRLSGFLFGCKRAPSEGLRSYAGRTFTSRVLFLGVRNDAQIVGMLTTTNAALAAEVQNLPESESRGVFHAVNLLSGKSTKVELARRLCEIHRQGWLPAKRLSGGNVVDCRGSNCGGYTLEAALGVSANSASEPDFLGWEVKQHAVARLEVPRPGPVTLMTPEPNGGVYVDDGVEEFVRRYGYLDKRGREDRMNFGGVHKCDMEHETTKLTLRCNGFDSTKGKVTNLDGGVELVDTKGTVAARWAFKNLLAHWKRKHGAAAFVPSLMRTSEGVEYQYGSLVSLGEGTDFLLLLKSLASGSVYYDPGIKLEGVASGTPTTKRRSQFRSRFADLASLYQRFEIVDVCKVSSKK